jgi:hypothetical protein
VVSTLPEQSRQPSCEGKACRSKIFSPQKADAYIVTVEQGEGANLPDSLGVLLLRITKNQVHLIFVASHCEQKCWFWLNAFIVRW